MPAARIADGLRPARKPFPSPQDWRDHWIYFLLVDRFNNANAPPRSAPWDGEHSGFQGGNLAGIRARLDYLEQLGVGALWLSPVLKNCQYNAFTYHGYGIQDFLQVEPRLCSDPAAAAADPSVAEAELIALIDEAHAHGIYVILDIVLNHAGDVFAYVLPDGSRSSETDWRDVPYDISWRDRAGSARPDWPSPPTDAAPDAIVWPRELQRNDFFRRQGRGGELGGDFASLKEFVTELRESGPEGETRRPVRDALIRIYQYAIARFDVDGFRIDTLKYVEPEFALIFGNAMREFALSIGKKNFFTFGEVYDDEEKVARFIGRQATQDSDLMGVDAALDFPMFFRLPGVAKGWMRPSELVDVFERRKAVERGVLSSHGEASRFFVTFLDNHDQRNRFFYSPSDAPMAFADQTTLALGLLFTLQGIPCLYYGTEQGLHGAGGSDAAVREALWGRPDAFDSNHPFYQALRWLSDVRRENPVLRYGRQYFRPVSGDGTHFGVSTFTAGVLAFSRILNDREVLIVANTSTLRGWSGEVLVDLSLTPVDAAFELLYSNKASDAEALLQLPGRAIAKPAGAVEIREVSNAVSHGPARSVRVSLSAMELQVLATRAE
jgi:glycosidase